MIHAIHVIFAKNEPTIQAWQNTCCTMTTTKTMKSIVIEQTFAKNEPTIEAWQNACCMMTTTKTMRLVVIEQNNAQRISITSGVAHQKNQQRWNITGLQ